MRKGQEEFMASHDAPLPRIPLATYRLQFNQGFRFTAATDLVAYLQDLGISDVYASPLAKATEKSLHGYDIVDPTVLNPEVGTEAEFAAFTGELQKYGLGLLLDIVPNHMAWDSANPWWMDILENGPASPYADFFTIDWHPSLPNLAGKLLLPFLGEPYGKTLENQELTLTFHEGAFFIHYHHLRLPLRPESYPLILVHRQEVLLRLLPPGHPELAELLSIVTALRHLPPHTATSEEERSERQREKEIIKKRLAALYREDPVVRNYLEENVRIINGLKEIPRSFDLLDRLLEAQLWRLAHWPVAADVINYRRFFDINNLAALRMEDPAVFAKTHALILRLIAERKVTGLRVDPPDGLYDPQQYFARLQEACFVRLASPASPPNQEQPEEEGELRPRYAALLAAAPRYRPFYIVGEKILTGEENLPESWPLFGTTGYDYLNLVNGLFVDAGQAQKFADLYGRFTGIKDDFSTVRKSGKRLVMETTMFGDLHNLGYLLAKLAEKHRHSRDFTPRIMTQALTEVIASFPVYRSYIHSLTPPERDRAYLTVALERATRNNHPGQAAIFAFLRALLSLQFPDDWGEEDRRAGLAFVMRLQQTTAPVMAKGVEDRAFYVYNRLLSLNEVGGNPEKFGLSVKEFHDRSRERLASWPHTLNATSTHDTKRSEDVRARINVLAEIPERWEGCLLRWSRLNGPKKVFWKGRYAPDRNEEYLLYQTLLGVWPLAGSPAGEFGEFKKRIKDYLVKALREAKIHSSWLSPDTGYESAVASFVEAILTGGPGNAFLQDFLPFQKTLSVFGMVNSLSQILLKIASPGIPDFFQGTELWDFSLVDPDNRRPVDFAGRQARLASLKKELAYSGPESAGFLRRLMAQWEEGTVKLHITRQALRCRREHQALFAEGAYLPLACEGQMEEHICAFARVGDGKAVLIAVPRLLAEVRPFKPALPVGAETWGETTLVLPEGLPGDRFKNVLTGGMVEAIGTPAKRLLSLAALFSIFPVAMVEMARELKGEQV